MAAASEQKYAKLYTSKKGAKNWIAFDFTPEKKDIDEAVLRLHGAYPDLKMKMQTDGTEGHHVTLYWGFDEKKFGDVKKMVEAARVPQFEVLRASDGRAVVALHESDDKSCVFAVLDMVPNVEFELARAMVGGQYRLPKSTYNHVPPHVTIAIGEPTDKTKTVNNKRKLITRSD